MADGFANATDDIEASRAAAPAPAAAAAAPKVRKSTVKDWSTNRVTNTLRIANMCNGLLLMMLGIIVFFVNVVAVTFTTVTVSAYVVFFGTLMTCLECNLGGIAPRLRRNFGFLFSFIGRTVFIVFCATMAYAMTNWLGYLIGSITFVNGFFNGFLICVHPAFKSGELSAAGDPYGGYTGGETEMMSYLKSNPALAQKAGSAAIKIAAANPDQTFRVMAAAHEAQEAKEAQAAPGAPGEDANNPWGK